MRGLQEWYWNLDGRSADWFWIGVPATIWTALFAVLYLAGVPWLIAFMVGALAVCGLAALLDLYGSTRGDKMYYDGQRYRIRS